MLFVSLLLSFYSLHFDRINQVIDFGNSGCFSPESSFTIEAWIKNLETTGFTYVRDVQIINTSYTDTLVETPIRVELDGVNFNFDHASADGKGIFFTEIDGRRLFYFVEEWDTQNEHAIIYVKYPLIFPTQTVTIKMFYGNFVDTVFNVPESVYFIYEDFSHTPSNSSTWGTPTLDTVQQYIIFTPPTQSTKSYLIYNINPGRYFEANLEFRTYGGSGGDAMWFGVFDTVTGNLNEDKCRNGYHFTFDEYENRLAFTKSLEINGTPISAYYTGGIDDGQWHSGRILFRNASVEVYYDGNLVIDATDNSPITMRGQYITIGARCGAVTNYHVVRFFSLKKLVEPEPVVIIGDENKVIMGINKWDAYSLMRTENGVEAKVNSVVVAGSLEDNWNHVAFVYDKSLDSNNLKLYINSILYDQATLDSSITENDSSFSIKGFNNLEIDELRFWDCALPESLIAQWMNRKVDTLHPLISHLVGFWGFDEGFNDTINDWTGNNPGIAINIDSTNWRISGAPLGEKSVVRKGKFVGVNLDDSLNLILNIYGSNDSTYFWATVSDTQPFYTGELPSNVLQIYPRFWNVKIFNSDNTLLRFYWTGLSVANSDSLRLLRRSDGSDTLWVDLTDVSIINQDEEYIELLGETEGQYIIGTTDTIPTTVSDMEFYSGINVVSSIGRLELITSSLHEDRCIEIYDISGRKLLRTYIEGKGRYVLGKNLNSGVYFFKILPWHIKGRFIVF